MVRLSFIYPEALWLLLLLIPLIGLMFVLPRRLTPFRFWASLSLRTILLLALILSLAGTQLVFPVQELTTIFLIDSSDSITPSARGQAEAFIQQAFDTMPADDQAGIVVFGENALVERTPSTINRIGRLASLPQAAHTNIEKAIQLGLALFPAETQKRLVLLSDGGENDGHARQAARLAATRGIPIDIVDLATTLSSDEALISSLHAPTRAREGQTIELHTTVESSVEQTARLRIFANQDILTDQEIQLTPGRNQFRYSVEVQGTGFQRYRVQIEPQTDGRVQNNESTLLVQVQGPPGILLVEGVEDEARNLQNALEATNMRVDVVAPDALPGSLTELSTYEAIVLVNVAARKLPIEAMANLPAYVRDLGKGLVMIGGTASYGVGGYSHTPIEEAMPVYMDVRDREERPNLAIVFLVDKSGSMDACHCAGNGRRMGGEAVPGSDRKVDIAKEAVSQASTLLTQQDTLSIVAFDQEAQEILPPTRDPDPLDVIDAVAPMEPRGGTNVGAGLLKAEEVLNNVDARIKHVVLLTDGWGSSSGISTHIGERMRENNITLSVVAAGRGSANYLEELALAGGGRYYETGDMSEVPQIFLNETITIAGNYIVEESFVPTLASDSTVLHGLNNTFPILYGYNGSTRKETARVILTSKDQSPILAEWNYGLGRSIAWTSDMKGKWGRNLVKWDAFPQFAAQLVDRVLPTSYSNEQVATDIRTEGANTTIVATMQDGDHAQNDRQMKANIIRSNNSLDGEPNNPPVEVLLSQIAPGEYRATLANPTPGTYLVQLSGYQDDRIVVRDTIGMVVPYSAEYRQNQSNPALLEELRKLTDGNHLTTPQESFAHTLSAVARAQEIAFPLLLLAVIVLPFDIALRRFLVRWQDMQQVPTWIQSRLPRTHKAAQAERDPMLTRLAQAKQRATGKSRNSARSTTEQESQPPATPPSTHTREDSPTSQPASSEPPTAQQQPAEPTDPLERLRQAKERARQRIRGTDE